MLIVGHAGIGWDDRNNLWCFPDIFVALSTHAKVWAKKVNPFVKVEYIPDGVDLNKFNPIGGKIELGLKRPIVLCVGALEHSKRIDLVIKAVAKLKNVSLLVVGRGELKTELEELGDKLLKDRFKLKEFDLEKMPDVYRSSDILVSASVPYYSFEMVLVEAMASNLPVIANKDQIREEIIEEVGILADPTNSDNFAGAIDSALKKNWDNKPQKQAENFSWERIIKNYEQLFKELSN